VSAKPSKPPAAKPGESRETVVPLRKGGPLAPKSRRPGTVSISLGIEDEDFVSQNPDGSIERTKITDDDA
jgi:hypothetical protein